MRKAVSVLALVLLMLALTCAVSAEEVVGMLEDVSMCSMTLHTDDNESLVFYKDGDTEIVGGDGLVIGEHLKVEYDYDNNEDYAETVTILESLIGTVKEATMHNLTIETENGGHAKTFTEDDDTQIRANKGVAVGQKVMIVYDGALSIASDVQNVKVWEVFAEDFVDGGLTEIDDEHITIDMGMQTYTFPIGHADFVNDDTVKEGNHVTIRFFGPLDDDAEIQQVTVYTIEGEDPAPEPETHHFTGTVNSISSRALNATSKKGVTYIFKINRSTVIKDDGDDIKKGDTVKCYFTGDYEKNMPVDRIKLVSHAKEEPASSKIAGRVVDATMNSVTIKSERRNYVFSIADGFDNQLSNGLGLGNDIIIYYTGTLKHSKKTQNVTVVKITDG